MTLPQHMGFANGKPPSHSGLIPSSAARASTPPPVAPAPTAENTSSHNLPPSPNSTKFLDVDNTMELGNRVTSLVYSIWSSRAKVLDRIDSPETPPLLKRAAPQDYQPFCPTRAAHVRSDS